MKYFLSVLALMFSLNVFAAVEVDTRGLTDIQKAQLVQQAEQMKQQAIATPTNVAESVDKWVGVGEKFGKMMGGAAKEIGIAVNEFIKTPVGMMTAALIIWNYMGSMIVHVAAGAIFFVVSFSLLTWYSRRFRKVVITYDKEAGKNWRGNYPILKKEMNDMDSDTFGFLLLGYAVSIVVTMFVTFTW